MKRTSRYYFQIKVNDLNAIMHQNNATAKQENFNKRKVVLALFLVLFTRILTLHSKTSSQKRLKNNWLF